jgi:hypothetical protein
LKLRLSKNFACRWKDPVDPYKIITDQEGPKNTDPDPKHWNCKVKTCVPDKELLIAGSEQQNNGFLPGSE